MAARWRARSRAFACSLFEVDVFVGRSGASRLSSSSFFVTRRLLPVFSATVLLALVVPTHLAPLLLAGRTARSSGVGDVPIRAGRFRLLLCHACNLSTVSPRASDAAEIAINQTRRCSRRIGGGRALRGEEADDVREGGGVLEREEVAALVDVEARVGTRSAMSSPLTTGAMPSEWPLATNVGQVMRPRRSTTSWWLWASSCPASPRSQPAKEVSMPLTLTRGSLDVTGRDVSPRRGPCLRRR